MRVRKEKVDEGFGLAFKPVDPDEGLVDVARLVPSVVVVLGKVGIVVGPRGGLGVLAEEAPQSVVHDLVVGLVPTCACPGGDLREDVVRQRRSESFLPTAIMQPSVPVGRSSLAWPYPMGVIGLGLGSRAPFPLPCGKISFATELTILGQSMSRNLATCSEPYVRSHGAC